MKIGVISHILESIPPHGYGGMERVVDDITNGLVERGHDVTLFATGDSHTKAELVAPIKQSYFEHPEGRVEILLARHMLEVAKRADEFDIWSNHISHFPVSLAPVLQAPIVSTLHGIWIPERQDLYEHSPDNAYFVSISDRQRSFYKNVNFAKTIYHGTHLETLHEGPGEGGYLAWIGRFIDVKGPVEAIDLANAAGIPVKLAAPLRPAPEPDGPYFDANIKPKLSKTVEYIGAVNDEEKSIFLGNAKALISPLKWEEPFGLVAIEAMACGTPVLTTRSGAMPEIVEHGVTGFIAESPAELAGYIPQIESLDRHEIRRRTTERFSIDRMVDEYEALFVDLADKKK